MYKRYLYDIIKKKVSWRYRNAKSTERGYRLCLRCKKLANTKAVAHKKPFCGHCLYGLYEAAMPVIIGESVAAVVYVGNAITEHSKNNTVCLQASISYRKEKNNSRLQYCSYFFATYSFFVSARWAHSIKMHLVKITLITHTPIYARFFLNSLCKSPTLISRTTQPFFTARPIATPAASPMQQTTGIILYDACAP